MKLIPLEEVRKLYNDGYDNAGYGVGDLIDSIERIPTIDPNATIDEMIEDRNETERRGLYLSDNEDYARSVLQELKSRLSLTQK